MINSHSRGFDRDHSCARHHGDAPDCDIRYGGHDCNGHCCSSFGYQEQRGVRRDYAHLAITLCRCMNIPARYCTGYLGDIGVPAVNAPMDFSAWFDAYLGGEWHTFDARHNQRRIGRILMARGRDATDVALTTTSGTILLTNFEVHTNEVVSDEVQETNVF
jgi:transglutaminase-like putative cysteine protease